jgi:hypothetical protein
VALGFDEDALLAMLHPSIIHRYRPGRAAT